MPTEEVQDMTPAEADDAIRRSIREWEERRERQLTQLKRDARTVFRAMEGWDVIKSREDWEQSVEEARDEFERGAFLIQQLGAERFLEPKLIATLLSLRRHLLDEGGATTVAEAMLADMAVLAWYNVFKVQGWIGNLAILIEHQFFGADGPSAKLRDRHGRSAVAGLNVEDYVQRVADELIPLLDRSNRMMIRNLRSLREWRQPPAPNVSIREAGQVNVAAGEQTNLAQSKPERARRRST